MALAFRESDINITNYLYDQVDSDSDSDSDNVYSTKIDTDTISGLQKT